MGNATFAPGPANLAGLVAAAAARDPAGLALVAGGSARTWADLDAEVVAVAAGLQARDLRFGDRVALSLPNSAGFVAAYLGALRAGLVVAPLDPTGSPVAIAAAVAEVGARLHVTDEAAVADLAAAGRAAGGAPAPGPVPGGEALAALLLTAGTGGPPKRAMLSHRALLANLSQLAGLDPAPVQRGDVVLLALPLFHVFGLNAVLGQALHAGATTVLALDNDPAAVLDLVASTGVTSVAGTPEMYAAWTANPGARDALAAVRVFVSGSAPLRPAEAAAFREATGRRVWQGYGLTEAAPVVTASLRAREGSVGRPLPGIDVRVVDRDGTEADDGDPGELWIRGANLFSGYWPDGQGAPDADGWFATGDVAIRDPDGDLFMVSTRHDVLEVDGFAVYPHEIEEVLLALPGVAEAVVVGAPAGERGIRALLVPAPGAELTADQVREFCAGRLARFKVPQQVELVPGLPRSVSGKIARGQLRPPAPGEREETR
ncbi:long-chain fatty acid--CoA ligase [Sporichthya brevicatena]|uniref:Long-chain fatty acid--CoA ligase n=1 Tax=Sporichthya brevicatena TaxID=171442 RepID=A0ABN1GX80_9ACTN